MTPRLRAAVLLTALLAAGCATSPQRTVDDASAAASPSAPKRIVAALMTNPITVFSQADAGGSAGVDVLDMLVNSGLSALDGSGARTARLAEDVPTVDNGRWKLLPDGRMETTWRIRSGARWHDGTPLTSDDLLFAIEVGQDRQLPRFLNPNMRFIEGADALDAQTITVRWNQPFIGADTLFTSEFVPPLPRHVLETQYRQNKANWEILTYWTTDFIGTGPFTIGDWEPGSHVRLHAFDQYLLGRPRVDMIEVRFIPDANALVASVLAGAVDMTLGRSISVEQAGEVERWPDGRALVTPYNLIRAFWQALTPDPAIIGNVQARRALLQAVNREELAANLQGGLAPAAYSVLYPGAFPEIEARLPRYTYDARAAAAQFEALGYRPGPDGMLRDAEARPLTVDITANFQDFNQKPALAMADYWKRMGVATTVTVVPTQLQGTEKLRYEAERPGFTVIRGNPAPQNFEDYHTSHARLADKGFNGNNRGRYMRAELDTLLDSYKVTIPQAERTQVLAQIMQHLSEQVVHLPLLYGAEPTIIANRLVNVRPRPTAASGNGNPAWNAHEWDVTP